MSDSFSMRIWSLFEWKSTSVFSSVKQSVLFAFLLVLGITQDGNCRMASTKTDIEIVKGIEAQDEQVLNYCYRQFGPMIKTWIVNNGGNESAADDIFQDGIIALYTNIRLGKFQPDKAKVSTYLLQICKYKWFDDRKSSYVKKTTMMEQMPEQGENPSLFASDLQQLHQQKQVHAALSMLKEQCRRILNYFYWEKKSMEEIASLLSMQINSVKNGKYRCMQSLKNQFKKLSTNE